MTFLFTIFILIFHYFSPSLLPCLSLQSSLGTVDLGQVYYEPLKDRQGNVLLVTVKDCAAHTKPPDLPLHWVPLAWLEKNRSRTPLLPEPTAMDTLTEQLKVTLPCWATVCSCLYTVVRLLIVLIQQCLSLWPSPGEAVLPQTQCPVGPAWPVRGHLEAVQHSGADQGSSAPEAAQPAMPRQSALQSPCVPVTQLTYYH